MRHISEILRAVGLDPIEIYECPGEFYTETEGGEELHNECVGGQVIDGYIPASLYSPEEWQTRECRTCGGSGMVVE